MKTVKPLVAVGSILVVMMAFQNCGQSAQLNSFSAASDDSTAFSKSSAEFYSSVVLTDPMSAKALDVDIASGQVRELDQRGVSTGERFCLSDEDRSKLHAVLKGAEVCQPVVQAKGGESCIQIYQYPYAELKDASHEVALGEKHHGCEIPADLCGDKAPQFKALVEALLKRIPDSSCN